MVKDTFNLRGTVRILQDNTVIYEHKNLIDVGGKHGTLNNLIIDTDPARLIKAGVGGYFYDPSDPTNKYVSIDQSDTTTIDNWDEITPPAGYTCTIAKPRSQLTYVDVWKVLPYDSTANPNPDISTITTDALVDLVFTNPTTVNDCNSLLLVTFSLGPTFAAEETSNRVFMLNEVFLVMTQNVSSWTTDCYSGYSCPDVNAPTNARVFSYHFLDLPIPKGYNQSLVLQWAFYL